MTARANASGVACCGNCGSELEVRCKGGCADPDVVFKESYIASLRKPSAPRPPMRAPLRARVEFCTWPGCNDRVEPYCGVGQPPRRCTIHKTKHRVQTNGRPA